MVENILHKSVVKKRGSKSTQTVTAVLPQHSTSHTVTKSTNHPEARPSLQGRKSSFRTLKTASLQRVLTLTTVLLPAPSHSV